MEFSPGTAAIPIRVRNYPATQHRRIGQLNGAIDRLLDELSATESEIKVATLGGLWNGGGAHTFPLEAFRENLACNPRLAAIDMVFDVVIRDAGVAAATVSSVVLLLRAGIESRCSRGPAFSQPLPARLEGYDELHWTILLSAV